MKKERNVFNKFYGKLAREGLLKSLMVSASIAFVVAGLCAFATWFLGINALWISLGIIGGLTLILTPIFYFKKFRPTTKSIAKRLDSLGLEERILTMSELTSDDSYIAMKQREDAEEALKKVQPKSLKYAISWVTIVCLSVATVFTGAGMTVNSLAANGIIADGGKIIDDLKPDPPEVFYTLKYVAIDYKTLVMYGAIVESDGGMFDGNEEQLVAKGEDGEAILALADGDYSFVGWLDGTSDPYRVDYALLVTDDQFNVPDDKKIVDKDGNVSVLDEARGWYITKDKDGNITIEVFALITELEDGNPEPGEEGDPSQGGEQEEDQPSGKPEDGDNENQGEDGEKNPNPDKKPGESDEPSKNENNNNKVINGETDYRERIDEYIKTYEELKAQGAEIPEELQKIIDDYYNSLD